MEFKTVLCNGESISSSKVDEISEKILNVIKSYELTLPAAEYILQTVKEKASYVAVIR